MLQIFDAISTEPTGEYFPFQFGAPPIQAYSATEFADPVYRIDDDYEWDGAWIDIGGES